MKVICNDQHWRIKEGKLILDTPEGQDIVKQMIKALDAQIRDMIHEEICALDFTQNRKQIMKHGIENALLAVQDACAKAVLSNRL